MFKFRANTSQSVLFGVLCLLILPTQMLCVSSALETQGEVTQGLLGFLSVVSLLALFVFFFFPRMAIGGIIAIAILIIPYQVSLLNRLVRLEDHMKRIVDTRLGLLAEGKPLPKTIDTTEYADPELARFVDRYDINGTGRGFSLSYFVENPGIARSYDSKTGWFYYPD